MQVDLQVEVPKGYELTGEYRIPKEGESFLNSWGKAEMQVRKFIDFSRLILRKVDTWRDATLDDLKRVMDGETVECRCRDEVTDTWRADLLLRGCFLRYDDRRVWAAVPPSDEPQAFIYYYHCQVKE
jgi:hypothetical protein